LHILFLWLIVGFVDQFIKTSPKGKYWHLLRADTLG